MTVSISTLGQMVLRRLGVRIVPLDDSPVFTEMVPFTIVAEAALSQLGVTISGAPPDTEYTNLPNIATNALIELGVVASDEVPSASDQALAVDRAKFMHLSLLNRGIVYFDFNHIPLAYSEEYIKLTAIMTASSFGKQADPALVALLEKRIADTANVVANSVSVVTDRVRAVHAALDAQGLVWWTGEVVPRAFFEEYAKITATHTASYFGKEADLSIIPALEKRIRQGVMVISADDNANQAVQAVHDEMVMRGIARWTSLDIPEPVGQQMVVIAADRLGSLFGVQTDADDLRAAWIAIYRFIALPSSGAPVRATYF